MILSRVSASIIDQLADSLLSHPFSLFSDLFRHFNSLHTVLLLDKIEFTQRVRKNYTELLEIILGESNGLSLLIKVTEDAAFECVGVL